MQHIGDVIRKIDPIETVWNGVRYRSRTEARWALFFTRARISFEYEPEAFQVVGGAYLPDFWLPEPGTFLEVKPAGFNGGGGVGPLGSRLGCRTYLACGPPRLTRPFGEGDGLTMFDPRDGYEDEGYAFCECPKCHRLGIEYEGRGDRVCKLRCVPDGDRGHTPHIARFKRAYNAVLWHRFWDPS